MSNSPCKLRQLREAFAFGTLAAREELRFRQHLEGCPSCRAQLDQHQLETQALVAMAPTVAPVQESELLAILAQLPGPSEAPVQEPDDADESLWFWKWLTPAIVLPALILIMSFQPPQSPPVDGGLAADPGQASPAQRVTQPQARRQAIARAPQPRPRLDKKTPVAPKPRQKTPAPKSPPAKSRLAMKTTILMPTPDPKIKIVWIMDRSFPKQPFGRSRH